MKHWKINSIKNYSSVHQWLARHFTKSGKCQLCKNINCRTEWANTTGIYAKHIKHFIEICVPCHKRMDYTPETGRRISIRNMGRKAPKTAFKKGFTPWNKGRNFEAISGSKNTNWKGGKVKGTCKQCKKDFEMWPYLAKQGKQFCSKPCGDKSRRGVALSEVHKFNIKVAHLRRFNRESMNR